MLPVSRDITLNGATPMPANLGNRLQDQIIGGKHSEFERGFSLAAFVPTLGAPAVNGAITGWVLNTGFAVMAAIYVPVGDRLTRARGVYSLAGGDVLLELFKFNAGVKTLLASANDNTSVGVTTHELAAVNYTAVTGDSFGLSFTFDHAAGLAGSIAMGGAVFHDCL